MALAARDHERLLRDVVVAAGRQGFALLAGDHEGEVVGQRVRDGGIFFHAGITCTSPMKGAGTPTRA